VAYFAPKIPNSITVPVIDGNLTEEVWQYADKDSLLKGDEWGKPWTQWDDNLIFWRAIWSQAENKLYVAVEVNDDIRSIFDDTISEQEGIYSYRDDCLEFLIDGDNNGGEFEDRYDDGQQFFVTGNNKIVLDDYPQEGIFSFYTGDAIQTATSWGSNGNWICEAAFTIYNLMPAVKKFLAIGDTIGWDIWYDDSDNKTLKGGKYDRDHQVGWVYNTQAAEYFGDIILIGDMNIVMPQINILQPNGQEVWNVNNTYTIRWQSSHITGNVSIAFSGDNGVTWSSITNNTPNNGTYSWTPQLMHVSDNCLIRVTSINEGVSDRSNSTFKIQSINNVLPAHWNYTINTGTNANIFLLASVNPNINDVPLMNGDYIGIFTASGLCCGWQQWSGQNISIVAWGNNPYTTERDGFQVGEEMKYRIFRMSTQQEWTTVEVTYSQGTPYFSPSELYIISQFYAGNRKCINLNMDAGWNMFSINVDPEDPSIATVMGPIENQLVVVKNGLGKIYFPEYYINEIGNIDYKEGYQIFLKNPVSLEICGSPVNPTTPIYLQEKWNMFAYLPDRPIDIVTALASINNSILIVKDINGKVYFPEFGINEIGEMQPGKGYQVYLKNDATLTYPATGLAKPKENNDKGVVVTPLSHFASVYNTGAYASLIIPATIHPSYSDGTSLEPGDEIGVFAPSGLCCGAEVWNGSGIAIAIWGDDPYTEEIDGCETGDSYIIKVWKKSTDQEYLATITYTSNLNETYATDAIHIASQFTADMLSDMNGANASLVPDKFELLQNYPNPFNPETAIEFRLPQTTKVVLNIYDMNGRLVSILINEEKQAGSYKTLWNAKDFPSGMYICKMIAGQFEESMKLMLVK
jgi:hypothetical protein